MKSTGYSFGFVRPVCPSKLFVCPEPYLSTYWSKLTPYHLSYCPCFSIGNCKAKPILAFFVWWSSHFIKAIIFNNFSLLDHDCQVPVDKHGSVKVLPHPLWPHLRGQVKYLNFAITKAIGNTFCWTLAYRQSSNRYETYQTGFQFEGLGPSLLGGLRGWGRGQN